MEAKSKKRLIIALVIGLMIATLCVVLLACNPNDNPCSHNYTASWSWSEDYTSVSAVLTCEKCQDKVNLDSGIQITTEPDEDECCTYTLHKASVTYNDREYSGTVKEVLTSDHAYIVEQSALNAQAEWSEDNSTASIVFVCSKNSGHVLKTEQISSSSVITDSSCEDAGNAVYRVTYTIPESERGQFNNVPSVSVTKEASIAPKGHDFTGDWVITAETHCHKCTRCDKTDEPARHVFGEDNRCECGEFKPTAETLFTFREIDGNKWQITGYNGDSPFVTIPSEYRGREVTELGMGAFYGNTSIKTVVIPNSIVSVRDGVFDGCINIEEIVSPTLDLSSVPKDNLKKITFTSGTSIADGQFEGFAKLAEVEFCDSITYVGKNAFNNTAWLNAQEGEVYINTVLYAYAGATPSNYEFEPREGTTAISPSAFEGKNVYQVTIPSGVQVGTDAFKNSNLQRAILPADAISAIPQADLTYLEITGGTSIDKGALAGCKNLREIVLPFVGGDINAQDDTEASLFGYIFGSEKPAEIGYFEETKQSYGSGKSSTFYIPNSLTDVTLCDGITSIAHYTFYGCKHIASITLPEGVNRVGNSAFSGCSGITKVNYLGSLKDWCGIAFGNSSSNPLYGGKAALYSKGDEVTEIKQSDGLAAIPAFAFYGCTGLQLIDIPSGVTSIGDSAFRGCTGLQTVNMPSSVTNIGVSAFRDCAGIKSVTLPSEVASISNYAFSGCSGITKVNYLGSLKGWCEIAFGNSSSNPLYGGKAELYLSDVEVTEIKDLDGLAAIPAYAFNGLRITSVTVPSSVTSIGDYAFSGCADLQSVTIGGGVQSIGDYAFSGCTSLTAVNWNATDCAEAGRYSAPIFRGCSQLATVNIGADVQSIPAYAFYGCTSLKDVYYGGDSSQWNDVQKGFQWDYYSGGQIEYNMHYDSASLGLARYAARVKR